MPEESFFYKLTVSISEDALRSDGKKVKAEFSTNSGAPKKHDSDQELQVLHRELLYALIGAAAAIDTTLRTAYWYVKLKNDYYYFTDVVLHKKRDSFEAILPAAYRSDEGGKATTRYIEDLKKIDMPYLWAENAGRILQDLRLTKVNDTWKLTADASLSRHVLGEFAGVLPCPGPWSWSKDGEWHKEKKPLAERGHRLVVGAWDANNNIGLSESLSGSLTALTSMLQSPKSHVTLIMGEPGAGKEVFSDAMQR